MKKTYSIVMYCNKCCTSVIRDKTSRLDILDVAKEIISESAVQPFNVHVVSEGIPIIVLDDIKDIEI